MAAVTETDPWADPAQDPSLAAEAAWLFAQEPTFLRGVVDLKGLPEAKGPEVAFAGRSNVGKSSLINALLNRSTVARTSNTPGRTRQLNFFQLTEGLRLVDLPGYGYARVSKTEAAAWTALLLDYLRGRAALKRVLLLIDARHGLKANDEEVMALFDTAAVNYMIVLTKADKLKPPEQRKIHSATQALARAHPACHPEVLLTSSAKGLGLERLRQSITSLADRTRTGFSEKKRG